MFKLFIGIDQTGAVDAKGTPKPLNVCMIDDSNGKTRIFTGLKLKKVSHEELISLIKKKLPHFKNQKALICIDSVIGLPLETETSFKQILKQVKNFSHQDKQYGAITAHSFFNHFLKNGPIKHRRIELKVKANSVFNLKPFQRNIGCGSYRVLKELSLEKKWFDIWPFEKPKSQFIIAEGYPSYFWKTLLGSKKRDLSLLQSHFKQLKFKNTDEADSFMLAYGALKSIQQINLKKIPRIAKKEGWMLGVPFD